MREYPHARDAERDTLLDMVALCPGMRVVDIQAAGGYLSDGVFARLGGQVECVCVEPVKALNRRLNKAYRVVEDPVDRIVSIASGSVDVVLGLAGLHHSPSPRGTLAEAWRLLKPGAEVAICDVIEGSSVARWLNEYVDQNNPLGHKGKFLVPEWTAGELRRLGFTEVTEEELDVPWVLPSRQDLARFFKGLFGLAVTTEEVGAAIPDYLAVRSEPGRILVEWRLIYAYGRKPPH
jgi:SAM-dependent methyltransferase